MSVHYNPGALKFYPSDYQEEKFVGGLMPTIQHIVVTEEDVEDSGMVYRLITYHLDSGHMWELYIGLTNRLDSQHFGAFCTLPSKWTLLRAQEGPEGVFGLFAPPTYLGNCRTLNPACTYAKHK